ncbi:MAG: hypothetical protein EP330_18285 [Deltaproteobacteria bacterium]|nr:MAG: hypothetical protein EP330_18285 [Deltaproteobacteria bacterium]
MLLLTLSLALAGPAILRSDQPEDYAELGVSEEVQAFEDGMRSSGRRGSVEWWYVDAHLDDGSTVVVNFLTKPIMRRGEPLHPRLELTVTEADGTAHVAFVDFPARDFAASTEGCDVRIGASYLRGDLAHYVLHAEAEGLSVDLTLERVVPSWRPDAGVAYFDEKKRKQLGWVVAVPHGTVRGTVRIGDEVREVTGVGYHDHNWANLAIERALSHWYWGRAHTAEYTLLFVDAYGQRRWKRDRLSFLLLAREGEILVGGGADMVTHAEDWRVDPGGREVPGRLMISVPELSVRLTEPVLLEREDLLESLPQPVEGVLKLFMHPWYFRFEAEMQLGYGLGPARVEAEGEAIFEYMLFR